MLSKSSRDLIIIMDERFDIQLLRELKNSDVWIIDSLLNRKLNEILKTSSSNNEITIFDALSTSTSDLARFRDVLSDADLHHGVYSESGGWHRLKIYGINFSDDLKNLLAGYSVSKITDHSNHLFCEKSEN